MTGTPPLLGSSDPWFGGQISPSITCVLAGNPSPMTLDGTNTWVISDHGRAVVVDPGPDSDEHLLAIVAALHAHDVRPESILLTHGHHDHSAGASKLAQLLRVGVRALDPTHRLGEEGLDAGDVVNVGERHLDVIATPGHSSDSLSFYDSDQGAVFTGDTLLGRGTTVVAWPDGSLADYLRSLQRLQRLADERELGLALPGHGPTVTEPQELLAQYLQHRIERLNQVRAAIDGGAKSVAEVVELVYEPLPPGVYAAAFASASAQWHYLLGDTNRLSEIEAL